MKTITRELAHVGMFGADGTVVTESDLADCAETFDGKCPISLGHTLADWMPKFGSVKKVSLTENGKSLVGDEIELNDLLADAVDAKLYDDISVGIRKRKADGKCYLHHVAYLGAIPPKIRDLKVFSDLEIFCMSDDDVVDYRVKKGTAPDQITVDAGHGKEENVEGETKLKEENEELKKQLADSKAANLATAKEGLKKAMEGKIPKGKQDLVLALADSIDQEAVVELADTEGKKESVTPLEALRRIIEAIPAPVIAGRTDLGDGNVENPAVIDLTKIAGKF